MKIITIGGLPAAGKTYTSKLLAQAYNCISLEYEALRWIFFKENMNKNLYEYTNYEKLLPNETLRSYYLRCTLYDNKVPLSELIKWHKLTMEFIRIKILDTIEEFYSIKNQNQYNSFCDKYKKLINYMPSFRNLNKEMIICSHAFINTLNFFEQQRLKIDFNSDNSILFDRFKNRENIINDLSENIKLYYKSYEEVLKDSTAIKLDTTNYKTIDELMLEVYNGFKN